MTFSISAARDAVLAGLFADTCPSSEHSAQFAA